MPVWSVVVALMAAIAWALGVPVFVALVHDYTTWSSSQQVEARAMPSWLVEGDAHTPLPAEERSMGPFVQRVERRAFIQWRGSTYEVIYDEIRFGLPFESLATGLVGASHITGTHPATDLQFITLLDHRMGWRKGIAVGRGAGGWPRVIPVMPKWGLLANALLVAAPIVVVATVWRTTVRRRRLQAGDCPLCGYERAVAAGSCSECGWLAAESQSAAQTPA
ncbi:MAG: hypothetical protein HRU13_03595 [Phycisphaerales bacterium]|nr:hypothetical protein [Phycisphaerales bacterium]